MMDYRKNPEDRYWRLPGFSVSVQALFIQLVAFCMALFFAQAAFRLTGWMASTLVFGLMQGVLAALITFVRRLPLWWLPIQLVFPLAMFLLLALRISPLWYLGAFFLLLLLFWGAIVTRVPLYLSGHAVWEAVENLLPKDRPLEIMDAGSGLGGLVLYLAGKRPDCHVFGIEISPFLWMVSSIRKRLSRSTARFMPGNYEKLDLGGYDVVFAYLSPVVMDRLWSKADSEMREGTLFLSLEFPVEDIDPDIRIPVENRVLFGWIMGKPPLTRSL